MFYMDPKYKVIALNLRKQGFSYSEILERIPVAKSTLSLWLREVGLSKRQKQHLTQKKLDAAWRGGQVKREQRILRVKKILSSAEKDIGPLTKRELWLIGVALYLGEGSKEKEHRPGSRVQFTNSDPHMIRLFLRWVHGVCQIGDERIFFEIYLHETNQNRIAEVRSHWAQQLKINSSKLSRIYFKKNKIATQRKNTGDLYYGLVRVNISASSGLNRQIAGWVNGIIKAPIIVKNKKQDVKFRV